MKMYGNPKFVHFLKKNKEKNTRNFFVTLLSKTFFKHPPWSRDELDLNLIPLIWQFFHCPENFPDFQGPIGLDGPPGEGGPPGEKGEKGAVGSPGYEILNKEQVFLDFL